MLLLYCVLFFVVRTMHILALVSLPIKLNICAIYIYVTVVLVFIFFGRKNYVYLSPCFSANKPKAIAQVWRLLRDWL